MGWRIVRDYSFERWVNYFNKEGREIPDYIWNMKGKQSRIYNNGKDARCKVYDDDNELCYEAVCDSEESAEAFHDWSMVDSGTTRSKIKLNGKWSEFIS